MEVDTTLEEQIPSPIEDVYQAGFDGGLKRAENALGQTVQTLVETTHSTATEQVADLLDAIEVDTYFTFTHTLIAYPFGVGFYKISDIVLPKQNYRKAPFVLVYLRVGERNGATRQLLPVLNFAPVTGNYTLQDQWHTYNVRRKQMQIQCFSQTEITCVYDIYILKDKVINNYFNI